jgi:cytochrome c biogenesis protein CcmG, thiol:disulfide interchange protein DsbE
VNTRTQWAVIGGVVAVLGLSLWFASVKLGDELFPLAIGAEAPKFSAVPVPESGATTPIPASAAKSIEDYKGNVVLLNIWATYCIPCRTEMPSMQRLHEQLAGKGLSIVAVSVDAPGLEATIRAFADEYKLTFDILYDEPQRIQKQYQTTGVPETFIIDRSGRIRRRIIGFNPADDWTSAANIAFIERLLAEPAG